MIFDTLGLDLDDGDWFHRFDTDNNPMTLELDGKVYDLDDPEEALRAMLDAEGHREALRRGELESYEGFDTEYRGGGRTRLLYDEVMAELACDKHAGKHDMSWEEMSAEADNIRTIRAKISAGK